MFSASVMAVLAFAAPAPNSATPLDVAVASTCDHLIVSVHNPTRHAVEITPLVGTEIWPSVAVGPRKTEPINVLGRDGLRVAITVDGGPRLGPWVWAAPAACPDLGGVYVDPTPAVDVRTVAPAGDHAGRVLAFVAFALMMLSLLLLGPMIRRYVKVKKVRELVRRTTAQGRHRQADQPALTEEVRFEMRRRIMRRWLLSRRG